MKESTPHPSSPSSTEDLKSCCAQLYEQDFVRLLLGDSFHPGGLDLTTQLGQALGAGPGLKVLDVASGTGASALHIAETFGCEVVGLDYGEANVRVANAEAAGRGLGERVRFQQGDSELLPFEDASFDTVVCECAFCTFPDKASAGSEFHRVLRTGGRLGLSDITRSDTGPEALRSLMAWVACIGDALTIDGYRETLQGAGFRIDSVSAHDDALTGMVNQIRGKLLGLEIAVGLKKIDLPGLDFANAKQMAKAALEAIKEGQLGYAILTATRTGD